ncbi:TasA family protein [Arthrobacter sp. G.S.26]|uniref:TasA family protein n=1 Tax=Arthrobacter sp. G.S.26 TaxID=3433706 RepID=UPI003D779863
MGLNLKSTTGKVLASTALIAAAASVAGLGTYGAFTSTTSASETVASGTVNVAVGATGTAANRLNVAATGLVAGDSVQRAVTLSNTGNQNLSAVTLTTVASPSTKLDTDTVNGLQLAIDACSVPWTEAGTTALTYTCAGTVTSVLAPRPVAGANMALAGLNSLTSAAADNLRVTVNLPAAADNTFQGLSDTIGFSFTGTQRTATNK